MDVNSVQPKMTTGQKVAAVAGGIAAAAGVAATVYAGIQGKKIVTDEFVTKLGLKDGEKAIEKFADLKVLDKAKYVMAEGFKKLGGDISGLWTKGIDAVKGLFAKIGKKGE